MVDWENLPAEIKEEKSTSDHIPRSMPTTFSHTTKTGPELRNGVALQSLLPFLSIWKLPLKKGVSVSRCCPPNAENIFWPELFLLLGTRQFDPETPHGKTTESPTTMAAAAIVVVVVVPVRLHQNQSKIPARIIKTILTKNPISSPNCSENCSTQIKTHNTQARIMSNLHARIFFLTKTNCTDMIHANVFYLSETIAIAHCVQKDLSQVLRAPQRRQQTAKFATEERKTRMRAASSCPFRLPEKVFLSSPWALAQRKTLGGQGVGGRGGTAI